MRIDCLQAHTFWERVVLLFGPTSGGDNALSRPRATESLSGYDMHFNQRKYFHMIRPVTSCLQTQFVVAEGNEAVIKLTRGCRSVALRHFLHTPRIDATWLFEVCGVEGVKLRHAWADEQVADLMANALASPEELDCFGGIAQVGPGVVESRQLKQVAGFLALGGHVSFCYVCCSRVLPQATCLCDLSWAGRSSWLVFGFGCSFLGSTLCKDTCTCRHAPLV